MLQIVSMLDFRGFQELGIAWTWSSQISLKVSIDLVENNFLKNKFDIINISHTTVKLLVK